MFKVRPDLEEPPKESRDDLISRITWIAIDAIVRGEPLRDAMYRVADAVWFWHRDRLAAEAPR
jgi:hypothetical protein